jgi:hypothetical protein
MSHVHNPLAQLDSVVLDSGPVLVASDQVGNVWQIPAFGIGGDWTSHGGQALAPPLALAASGTGLVIAALGGAALLNVWSEGRWRRWIAPPDTAVGFVAVAAATDSDRVAHAVCISGSGRLWDLPIDGRDQFTAFPVLPVSLEWVAAVGTPTGIVVMAIGEADRVYTIRWTGTGRWTNLGDPPTGASELAAAVNSSGLVTACVVGLDGSLYNAVQSSYEDGFGAWAAVGAGTPPSVDVVRSLALARSDGARGALWAHVIGTSGVWRMRTSDGKAEQIGFPPGVPDLLTLTAYPMGGDTAVAALDQDGTPWRASRSGSTWRWSAVPAVPAPPARKPVNAVLPATEVPFALSSPFNMCCFLTAHNAYANPADGWAYCQQGLSLARQLEYGVRALMLDAWDCTISGERDAYLAHSAEWVQSHLPSPCATFKVFLDSGQDPQTLASAFATIAAFLVDHRTEVVTVFLESHLGDPRLLSAALAEVSDLIFYADRVNQGSPTNWNVATDGWPTLQWMIGNNKRLALFSENRGDAPAVPYVYDWVVETVYGNASLADACVARPESLPLDTPEKLFVMNHFPTSSSQNIPLRAGYDQINDAEALAAQRDRCHTVGMKYPNFVAVDYVDIGNNGGPLRAVHDINDLIAGRRSRNERATS